MYQQTILGTFSTSTTSIQTPTREPYYEGSIRPRHSDPFLVHLQTTQKGIRISPRNNNLV